jgi:hypothetical protein
MVVAPRRTLLMDNLKRLGKRIAVSIPNDEDGYLGRECPKCESYFKVTLGTGITTGNPPCQCPYCGEVGSPDVFWTKGQIEYARSVALNKITGAVLKDLKKLEFSSRPRGDFGIGITMKVEGRPHPICYFHEPTLETEVVCDGCTLRYAIYGVFAYCPDCGEHNSLQILEKNLELADKQLTLAATLEGDLSAQLIADALENGVSAFDAFGREVFRVHAGKASNPAKAEVVSFQNLAGAQKNVQALFGVDLASGLTANEWDALCRSFQKRHLLAHNMGIVDEEYLKKTSDPQARMGRKVPILSGEVSVMLGLTRKLGRHLATGLKNLP